MVRPEDWEERWREKDTPWDLGGVTPALIEWCRERNVRGLRVLVPGCGRGHDAHFLAKSGADVTALDVAPSALEAARACYPHSSVHWEVADILSAPFSGEFDLVWEYTCFCALDPSLRSIYLAALASALKHGGRYLGLVFQEVPQPDPSKGRDGPPFAIDAASFEGMLSRFFALEHIESPTRRSVKPRMGNEIWFSVRKP